MLGEELQCIREIENAHNLYTVSVVKTGTGPVGHLPKKIPTSCHFYFKCHIQIQKNI